MDLSLRNRIEIKNKNNFIDGREKNLLKLIYEDVNIKLNEVKIIDIYNLFGNYSKDELLLLKNQLFCDLVFQEGSIEFHYAKIFNYNYCIEVSYLPGITDNIGRTAAKGINNIFILCNYLYIMSLCNILHIFNLVYIFSYFFIRIFRILEL